MAIYGKKMGVFEEEIFLGHYEGDVEEDLFKYYLSNSLNELENIINRKTINNIPKIDEMKWENNTDKLAQKVKDIMLKLDVNYSMTIFPDRNNKIIEHVAINWHTDGKWLYSGGVIISKKFYSYEEIGVY